MIKYFILGILFISVRGIIVKLQNELKWFCPVNLKSQISTNELEHFS